MWGRHTGEAAVMDRPWHYQLLSAPRTVKALQRIETGEHVFYRLRGGMVVKLSPLRSQVSFQGIISYQLNHRFTVEPLQPIVTNRKRQIFHPIDLPGYPDLHLVPIPYLLEPLQQNLHHSLVKPNLTPPPVIGRPYYFLPHP